MKNTDERTKRVRGERPTELTDEQVSALANEERERTSLPDLFATSIGIEALKAERRVEDCPDDLDDYFVL